ncbi:MULTISPECIES: HD-GYP domain-containing protein [unclassified Fusibacter]|uniref:HD-GYP domain-containing protein n=1 Tax=unclassified Fusibacter TaxID=2624464 RepID=UPI0010108924|nr:MULTISPECIES: HD-GYP domain-containing protein [unclassified Fusibacter]MCK8060125.1 HD-GYP domain-containing protein [Fusibacter sp. A2]NPE22267.1 HD-GYP domain-containing protein [Fusibacter sp. A1]RXV61041.1 HD-GYP domain-containing protein [Fusibacter sp. A1]
MRLAQVGHQLIGNQLLEPVFTEHGSMLLQKGTVVNNDILEKLLSHNVNVVHVIDQASRGIQPVGIIEEDKMEQAIENVKEIFDDILHKESMGVKALIPNDQIELVKNVVDMLIETLSRSGDILYTVSELIGTDAYTYKHSVNVAVLSILTAKGLNYVMEDIKNIALGALLHDIGKARIDQDVIQKPGKLTPAEIRVIQKHPQLGYELLKDIEKLPYLAKQIVLLHHEKLDGSGYPLGISGIEIPEYVQIVTVCDMYDAMTTNRVYRSKMAIYEALDILMVECIYRIDRNIFKQMMNNICMFPPGSGVVLSDGRIGIVASYRASNPSRPRVRILNLEAVLHYTEIQEVNLEKEQTLFIEDVWDVETFKKGFGSSQSVHTIKNSKTI